MAELVIFDCDGVLVDSDRISLRIQAERISALGLKMTYEDYVREFLGLGMEATLEILAERLGRPPVRLKRQSGEDAPHPRPDGPMGSLYQADFLGRGSPARKAGWLASWEPRLLYRTGPRP